MILPHEKTNILSRRLRSPHNATMRTFRHLVGGNARPHNLWRRTLLTESYARGPTEVLPPLLHDDISLADKHSRH